MTVKINLNYQYVLPTADKNKNVTESYTPTAVVLAHELIHASHMVEGTQAVGYVNYKGLDGNYYVDKAEEFNTVGGNGITENSIRNELGYAPRAYYSQYDIDMNSRKLEDVYSGVPDFVIQSMEKTAKLLSTGKK